MTSSPWDSKERFWSIRLLPVSLACIFIGAAPFLLNPGLFWDDWLWKYTDADEHVRIGRQLGVWWAGYLSQAINGSAHTVLICRAIAFMGWILSAVGFSVTLYLRGLVARREAFFVFLAICVCHVAPIRYVESMAMANVYIGSFWIGCAILFWKGRRPIWLAISIVLFLFSFHLNSMVLIFALVVAVRFFDSVPPGMLDHNPEIASVDHGYRLPQFLVACAAKLACFWRVGPKLLLSFLRKDYALVLTPVLFVLLIKVPSVVLARVLDHGQNLYGSYNTFSPASLFSAFWWSLLLVPTLVRQYLSTLSILRPVFYLSLFSVFAVLLAILPRSLGQPNYRTVLKALAVGIILVFAGVYPYVLVGKTPVPSDFYESRHFIAAAPGVVLVWLSLFTLIPAMAPAKILWIGRGFQLFLVAGLLSAGTSSMLLQGLDLFRDWMQQEATSDFLRRNKNTLSDYHTVIFDDASSYRIGNRYIWNYEYTGSLVALYSAKDRFGISIHEYSSLPPDAPLLKLNYLRKRYNIKDYEFLDPHLYLRIEDSPYTITPRDALVVGWKYWVSADYHGDLQRYFLFTTAGEYTEADQIIAQMRIAVSKLISARRANGYYPAWGQALASHGGGMARRPLGQNGVYEEVNAIQDIGVRFKNLAISPICADEANVVRNPVCARVPKFTYLSDGVDFKLVFENAKDLPYAKQAFGSMIDESRAGYGFWTWAAAGW